MFWVTITSRWKISSKVNLGLFLRLFRFSDLCFLFRFMLSEYSSMSVPLTTLTDFFLALGRRSSSTLKTSSSAVSSSLLEYYRRFFAMKLSCSRASSLWEWTRARV